MLLQTLTSARRECQLVVRYNDHLTSLSQVNAIVRHFDRSFGRISSVFFARDNVTSSYLGHGIFRFVSPSSAQAALNAHTVSVTLPAENDRLATSTPSLATLGLSCALASAASWPTRDVDVFVERPGPDTRISETYRSTQHVRRFEFRRPLNGSVDVESQELVKQAVAFGGFAHPFSLADLGHPYTAVMSAEEIEGARRHRQLLRMARRPRSGPLFTNEPIADVNFSINPPANAENSDESERST